MTDNTIRRNIKDWTMKQLNEHYENNKDRVDSMTDTEYNIFKAVLREIRERNSFENSVMY